MKKKPIFIHALFRTGSSYLWNVFRDSQMFYCYYEPFHQWMIDIGTNNKIDQWYYEGKSDIHKIKKPVLFEYTNTIDPHTKNIPFFKKSMILDEFTGVTSKKNTIKYIDHLSQHVPKNNIPFFQFNRTSLRIGFFKNHFENGCHIMLFRNPRDQWESYQSFQKPDTFNAINLMLFSLNKNKRIFKPLNEFLESIEFRSDNFDLEFSFYNKLIEHYTNEEKYLLFYYIWVTSFVKGIISADKLINIDKLSSDKTYQLSFEYFFKSNWDCQISFEKTKIKSYTNRSLSHNTMLNIESFVISLVMNKAFCANDIKRFKSKYHTFTKDLNNYDHLLKLKHDNTFKNSIPFSKKTKTLNDIFYENIIREKEINKLKGINTTLHQTLKKLRVTERICDINLQLKQGTDVIIFGTGSSSKILLEKLDLSKINLICFFDNYKNTTENPENIPVTEPTFYNDTKIIIASSWTEEIYQQLIKLGYSDSSIFKLYI